MKKTLSLSSLVTLAAFAALAGCASSSAPDERVSSARAAAEKAEKAENVADLGGTWDFVLTASDVATPLRDKCAKAGGGDAAKADACFGEIAAEASREKIRFTKADGGTWLWTSFEIDGKTESVYVEVPLAITSDGPGHLLAKAAGAPRGAMAERYAKSSPTAIRIELVNDRTIAMTDPQKGRLVYTKQ